MAENICGVLYVSNQLISMAFSYAENNILQWQQRQQASAVASGEKRQLPAAKKLAGEISKAEEA
jgi:hypothetical protein